MSRTERWALLAILLAALGVRVAGCLGQGLPHSFYDDEKGNVLRALKFGANRDLNPGWFHKPALGYYTLFAGYTAYYGVGRLTGAFDSAEDLALDFFEDQGPFYLIGRLGNALLGTLTVLLVFLIARRLGGAAAGLAASLALAFTPGHVAACQVVKMDALAAFFATAALLLMLHVAEHRRRRAYLGAGLMTGLGAATKYYPGVLVLTLVGAHLLGSRGREGASRGRGRLLIGVLAVPLGFALGSPYSVIDGRSWAWLGSQLKFAAQRVGMGAMQFDLDTSPRGSLVRGGFDDAFTAMVQTLWDPRGLGSILVGLALLGLLVACVRRRRQEAVVLLGLVCLVLVMTLLNRSYSRSHHLAAIYPLCAVLVGSALALLARPGTGSSPPRRSPLPVLVLVVLLFVPLSGAGGLAALSHDRACLERDPRLEALEWIEQHVPAGACILNDHGRMPLMPSVERCDWVLARIDTLVKLGVLAVDRAAGYRTWWGLRRKAALRSDRRTFDAIDLVHDWQVERLARRLSAGAGYNPLWPRSPWGWVLRRCLAESQARGELEQLTPGQLRTALRATLPAPQRELAPVQLWTRATLVSRAYLSRPERPVQWLVSSRVTFENYRTTHKRREFPDFAAFYQDLEEHYDRYEFHPDDPDPARAVRIYDLRRRVDHPRVTRLP